jgi:hypothetical protein
MDSVVVAQEPNAQDYIEKYHHIRDWRFKDDSIEVLNVKRFSHKKGDKGCVVVTQKHSEINFSDGSVVIRGE